MFIKKFRIKLTLNILLLTILIFLLNYIYFETSLYATMIILGIIIVLQILYIINYIEKTNQYLIRFFEAIRYSDFSQSFSIQGLGSSFDELRKSLSSVIDAFQKSRSEKEEHYRYLQTVVKHVGIGLIAFKKDGSVELINTAAKRLFRINHLKNIHALDSFSPKLSRHLLSIKPRKKTLLKITHNDEMLQLAIYTTEFKLGGEQIILISLQNIQGELEEKEMEAWQNLIRVLTHEIMNSITPITSLAETVNDLLLNESNSTNYSDDIKNAVRTIKNRSEGLLHFVNTYRQLTRLPKPDFQILKAAQLIDNVYQLMKSQMEKDGIHFESKIDPHSLEVTADPQMMEQVLINLLTNAIYAVKELKNPEIILTAQLDRYGRVLLMITDNGTGILPEVQERIFIPFFTTKKEGSGIGLSMCKQIIRLHNGSINVKSSPDNKTTFTLTF